MIDRITDDHYAKLASDIGCHPATLEAIAKVESGKSGWFADGKMKILFEKHWFYKKIQPSLRTKAVRAGLARAKWVSPKNGGYKDQRNPTARYNMLRKAVGLDEQAAYQSVSMGIFQIMGFNYAKCGFISAKEMYTKFSVSEVWQYRAFVNFLKANNLFIAIREGDFQTIEKRYNGGGLGGLYAKRMRLEEKRLKAGKWKNWKGIKDWKNTAPEPVKTKPPVQKKVEEVVNPPVRKTGFWQWLFSLFGRKPNGKAGGVQQTMGRVDP